MNALAAAVDLNSKMGTALGSAWTPAMTAAFVLAGLILFGVGCRLLGRCRESHAARYTGPRR